MRKIYFTTFIIIAVIIACILIYINSKQNNIVVIALGKSGSTYTTTKIAQTLNYELGHMDLWFDDDYMQNFKYHTPKILKTHIAANKDNLARLQKYVGKKIVVHVRDPRAALLSSIYHLNEQGDEILSGRSNRKLKKSKIKHMQKYLSFSLEEKKDYLVDEIFELNVKWIEDWCATKEIEDYKTDGLKILITTYDELTNNESDFFEKIYLHYNINSNNIIQVTPNKDKRVRFRSGKPDEWRQEFSKQQIDRMNQKISQSLLDKFGWQK